MMTAMVTWQPYDKCCSNLEVLIVGQPKKVSISLGRGLVPWLCSVLKMHLYVRQKNQDNQVVALVPINIKHLSTPRICKLLLPIYLGI